MDTETPQAALTFTSFNDDGQEYELVFSDEFNTDGRTFYPGDDPFWEAVDLHYWQTDDLEWYDPAAITTSNGSLQITLSEKQTHGLNYQGGMMTTWNKFCFTGGLLLASVNLPGDHITHGFWPAVWALGNLGKSIFSTMYYKSPISGRAGYGASLDGMHVYVLLILTQLLTFPQVALYIRCLRCRHSRESNKRWDSICCNSQW